MKVANVKQYLLKGLIISSPFGWWSPFSIPYTSLTFLLLYGYLTLSFLTIKESFSWRMFKAYALPLLLLWVLMLIMTLKFYSEHAAGANSVLRQFVFNVAFFSFALKDVALLASRGKNLHGYFLIAVFVLILAFFGGLSKDVGYGGRQSLAGVNPNLVAMYCAGGFIILVDWLVNASTGVASKLTRYMAIGALFALAVIIALTGSRGGVVILTASLMVYFVSWSRISIRKLTLIVPLAVCAFMLVWFIASTSVIAERMGDLDSDIRITTLWPAGLKIVQEHPLFGVGLGHVESLVRGYTGFDIALHNEYLKIATASGLVGLFLFLVVLKRLLSNALYWRRITGSGLQLALWVLVAVFLVKGGGALGLLFVWIVFLMLSGPPIDRSAISQIEQNTRQRLYTVRDVDVVQPRRPTDLPNYTLND